MDFLFERTGGVWEAENQEEYVDNRKVDEIVIVWTPGFPAECLLHYTSSVEENCSRKKMRFVINNPSPGSGSGCL